MRTRLWIGILALTLLSSCASALKRQCERTNWFEYGENAAKSGNRVGDDSFVLRCEKEEALVDHAALSRGFQKGQSEYCTADYAFLLGKRGEFLSEDLCSGNPAERAMQTKHKEGVLEYCQESNGISAGLNGKKYNQICPKDLEAKFLPKFYEGRKKFISGVIVQKQGQIQDLQREISILESKKVSETQELRISEARKPSSSILINRKTGAKLEQTTPQNQAIDREIAAHRQRIHQINNQIDSKHAQESKLWQEIRELQGELATL